MSITISIIFEPIWEELAQHLHVVECAPDGGPDDPRLRIEFLGLTEAQTRRLAMYVMRCVHCERPNHPLRRRLTDTWDQGRLYYAPACALSVNVGCSRGRAAELEYERFKAFVGKAIAPQRQMSLFQ